MEKKELDFIIFKDEHAKNILASLNFQIKNGRVYNQGKIKKCDCCNKPLEINNVGNILYGSNLIYCKNTACFEEYLREKMGI